MKSIALVVASLLTISGCASQLPIPANHPISTQKKARSVHHWEVLAADLTSQIITSLDKQNLREGKKLFVVPPKDDTTFNFAFRNFLITQMVKKGLTVTNTREDALELEYETQAVRHDSGRYTHIPGTFTTLAAGIWVVRDLIASGSGAIPGAIGLSGLADYGMGHYGGSATPTEVIITSSIILEKSYVMRRSDVYYIEDPDVDLFTDPQSPLARPSKTLGVTDR